jgi:UDP-glucose 4-epimerase
MRVLVTGGAGYIGSHVAKALAGSGHVPIVLDDFSAGHRWAVRWGDLIEDDLTDTPRLASLLMRHGVQAVVHLAANAYVGESVAHPRKYFRNNVVHTLNLLDAMLDAGVSSLVFSSSCATYGLPA